MSDGQRAADLRALVARRAGVKRRVALLSSDEALAQALRQNGCEVLVDPESFEALAAFEPAVVVAFDALAAEGAKGFAALARAVPTAELLFSFANASAASGLVRALGGHTPALSSGERDVRAWLAQAGWVVTSRDVVVVPHAPSGLSADTEAALRQLLEQLNPDAAADRLLLTARRGEATTAPEPTRGLVSVLVSAGDDAGALEGTLKSVAGQLHAPLEVVVVAQLPTARLEALVKPLAGRAGVAVVVAGDGPADGLARTNRALEAARGQYLCALEAGELLDRAHLGNLVRGLEAGTAAWALSAAPGGPQGRFELAAWLDAGGVHRGRYLLDRTRLGAFALQYAEGLALGEAMFFCRLAALFPPAVLPGAPTLDSPRKVESSRAALREALRGRPLRTLATLGAALEEPPPVDVRAEVTAQLEATSPLAAKLFARAADLGERVRAAAAQARAAAKDELERK